jgi:transcription elongation GreA/GreB family factor
MTMPIVGVDEADLDRGQVSWLSPVARALMKAHQHIVNFARRRGHRSKLAIRYGVADSKAC